MYIAQALKIKHNWWRYLLGILIIFIGWQFIGVIPLGVVAFIKAGSLKQFLLAAESNFMSLGIDTNFYLVLVIVSFAGGLIAIWFSSRYIHEQSFTELTTSRKVIDWKRICFSYVLVTSFSFIFFIISYFSEPEIFKLNFKQVPFLILFLVSFFLLPLQTSFEEYLFRGYFMQGLGVLTKSKWLPLAFTSITFGLLHYLNPEVEKLGASMMIFYIGTGLLLGIMTLMDEGMELALGFHAANNFIAAILVTTDWSALQTDAMFIDISEPTVGLDIVLPILIMYPIYLLIFAKKYNWTGWKDKLFGEL